MNHEGLRLGNYVTYQDPGSRIKITTIDYLGESRGEIQVGLKSEQFPVPNTNGWMNPIELKADHLIGSGFVQKQFGYQKGEFMITSTFNFMYGVSSSKSIKYVHELQNLYYALTGEELELNIK